MRRVKGGIRGFASVSEAFRPVDRVHLGNPGSRVREGSGDTASAPREAGDRPLEAERGTLHPTLCLLTGAMCLWTRISQIDQRSAGILCRIRQRIQYLSLTEVTAPWRTRRVKAEKAAVLSGLAPLPLAVRAG